MEEEKFSSRRLLLPGIRNTWRTPDESRYANARILLVVRIFAQSAREKRTFSFN
jgi:hypothetical protein